MPAPFDDARFRKLLRSYPAAAMKLLYDLHYSNLYKIARHLTNDEEASKDIVQETFVHVWENHKVLGQDHEYAIAHYLVKVLRNKAITFYHKQKKKVNFLSWLEPKEPGMPIENEIIERETALEVRKLISTFPPRERECLLMKIDNNMSTKQIAEHLKVTPKAVQRSLTSANKRLRKYRGY